MAYLHGVERSRLVRRELSGKRLGLITNPSGVSREFIATVDMLFENFELVALFSPEHGVRGDAQAGDHIGSYTDPKTSLPVYSMYGSDHSEATAAIAELDCIVYDVQDVGLRFYTYIYTLAEAMTVAARSGVQVVVLDRCDPLGLDRVEGNLLDDAFSSGVGKFALPSRYGLTVGEFARYVNAEYKIGCELSVIPCEGLKRSDRFRDLGLPWVLPSPNLPTLESTLCYTGTVLFEGTNLSEGRGTTKPFELIGAPWLRAEELCAYFNSQKIEGALLRPTCFKPTFSKHAGKTCYGFQVHVTDPEAFEPFALGVRLIDHIRRTHEEFDFREGPSDESESKKLFIDLLLGCRTLRQKDFDAERFIEEGRRASEAFRKRNERYHLYV